MSIYSASVATTPILKSANTSLNRKRIQERIRNTVQFQLISQNGLRRVLEDALHGENIGAYEDYLRAMRDIDLSDADFSVLIRESRECIELLTPKCCIFVETIIGLNWIDRDEKLIIEYQNFLIDLLSVHNKYTNIALRTLISSWVPNKIDEHLWKNGVPEEKIKKILSYNHQTLSKIMDVIPMSNDFIMDTIEKQFPYYTKSSFIVAGYVHNLMWLLEYRPLFREDILLMLIKNIVMMDVSVRRIDIETAERIENDAEEIFKMDAEDIRNNDDNEMRHPIAETIDLCMEKLFTFLLANGKPGFNIDTRRQENLFRVILKAFEEYILPTHKTSHIQFTIFYFCSFTTSIAETFINYLCYKVWDPNFASSIRQSAVGYIASILARGKFIPLGLIKQTIHELCAWAHNYISKSDSNQNTMSLKAHYVFYAVCEAIFYVVAFRSRDLTNSNENLNFLQSLQLSTLVTCHLNPLRVCLPAVATAFAGVTRSHQLAYCHTILERNARRKLATVYQNEVMMPEETLDTTFPFDPYLLKKSGKFIHDIYKHYQPCDDEDTNSNCISITNEQRRRKRVESLSVISSLDDDDFINEHKRNKLAESIKNMDKEMLFTYGTSPGFH